MKLDLEAIEKAVGNFHMLSGNYTVNISIMHFAALLSFAKEARQALEFMTMPITTPKKELTVDRLLKTMGEDMERGGSVLNKYFEGKE